MSNGKIYIETYGCQMNFNDTEIVSSILQNSGYEIADKIDNTDVILLNTCSVRDNAERKIFERLKHLNHLKKINKISVVGIIGCMAERLQKQLIEEKEIVDVVIGPDEYRKTPMIIENALNGEKGLAVRLSTVETYDDITPLRKDGISAWISIMRGCNNFCSYCVVPFTRGRERSRNPESILSEVESLKNENFREITLLGQNVNSYSDSPSGLDFSGLLSKIAELAPDIRIRFITSHPADMSDKLIETMAQHKNICRHIHLPVQSGSDRILEQMNRRYSSEHYLGRIAKIRELMPDCALSTDIIAGFPSETIEEHNQTLELMKKVRYDGAFMFRYSPREHTKAFKLADDVPEKEKIRRLNEIIELQQKISKENNQLEIGKVHRVLAEHPSKRNKEEWQGRTEYNKTVIFNNKSNHIAGDLVEVKITKSSAATLFGEIVNIEH